MSSKTSIVVSSDAGRELTFDVVLREPRGESRHRVTVSPDDAARFAKLGADPARAVEAAMAFLLDREFDGVDFRRVRHQRHSPLFS